MRRLTWGDSRPYQQHWRNAERALPPGERTRGRGFWVEREGLTLHVNGARGMSDETLDAIVEMAQLAYAQFAKDHGGD
jgi:hypothetical protein